jgi:hypothetical protein
LDDTSAEKLQILWPLTHGILTLTSIWLAVESRLQDASDFVGRKNDGSCTAWAVFFTADERLCVTHFFFLS